MKQFPIMIFIVILLLSCGKLSQNAGGDSVAVAALDDAWGKHWYDGKGEVNTYSLNQSRYADVHPGDAVLIFVTEDFMTETQVKDEGRGNGNSTSVLKTNILRRFTTGLYDYSIMSSVFTPVDRKQYPNTLKVTTSSQDWCGHSFMQLNRRGGKYKVQQFSYFQKEGDASFQVTADWTEDELLNLIRLNPGLLPKGEISVLPGTVFARLKHIDFQAAQAIASNSKYEGAEFEGDLMAFTLEYPDYDRTVEVFYESKFPHQIVAWKESYLMISGERGTTTATLKHSERLPYWSLHDLEDMGKRDAFGL